MTHRYYVCPVLPPGPVIVKDDDGNDAGIDEGWRPKISDLLNGVDHSWVTDIPNVSRTDGTPVRLWCIVAVEVTAAVHAILEADPDIFPLKDNASSRSQVRLFLRDNGEDSPPDRKQAVLTRLHPVTEDGHVPAISDLHAGSR